MRRSTAFVTRLAPLFVLLAIGAQPAAYQPGPDQALADGVRYRNYQLDGPLSVDVVEIDTRRADARLVAWRSGGLARTTQQARDASAEPGRVLAALNADFFSFQTTWPIGHQITNGETIHALPSDRSHLVVRADGGIYMGPVDYEGYVTLPGGRDVRLHGVNRRRDAQHAVWYTAHAKDRARSDSTGFVWHLRTIGGGRAVTVRKESGYGPASVGSAMLSVGPDHPDQARLAALHPGDTLVWVSRFRDPSLHGARQALGGGGMILERGEPVTDLNRRREGIGANFMNARHPRTFVAVNRDQSRIWLCTVDGRQEDSIGMTFADMAEFLLSLGAWDAINLDGGGSTTMVVDGHIVNSPSDLTGERAVANVLLLIDP